MTAYELRIRDWSSDVCSSDLLGGIQIQRGLVLRQCPLNFLLAMMLLFVGPLVFIRDQVVIIAEGLIEVFLRLLRLVHGVTDIIQCYKKNAGRNRSNRSEEHTSELQSLMRISYAVSCLTKKNFASSENSKDDT